MSEPELPVSSFLWNDLPASPPPQRRTRADSVAIPSSQREGVEISRRLSVADATMQIAKQTPPSISFTASSFSSFLPLSSVSLTPRTSIVGTPKYGKALFGENYLHELLLDVKPILRSKVESTTDIEILLAAAGIVYEEESPTITKQDLEPLPKTCGRSSTKQKKEWGTFDFHSLVPKEIESPHINQIPPSTINVHSSRASTSKRRSAVVSHVNMNELDSDVFTRTRFKFSKVTESQERPATIKEQILPTVLSDQVVQTTQKIKYSRQAQNTSLFDAKKNCKQYPMKRGNIIRPKTAPAQSLSIKNIMKLSTLSEKRSGREGTPKAVKPQIIQLGQELEEVSYILASASDPFSLKKLSFKQVFNHSLINTVRRRRKKR
jgi:hypothetical protein